MEKVHGHGLLAFSRGTNVAEARFCCAKIAPQGFWAPGGMPLSADCFEPFFSIEQYLGDTALF